MYRVRGSKFTIFFFSMSLYGILTLGLELFISSKFIEIVALMGPFLVGVYSIPIAAGAGAAVGELFFNRFMLGEVYILDEMARAMMIVSGIYMLGKVIIGVFNRDYDAISFKELFLSTGFIIISFFLQKISIEGNLDIIWRAEWAYSREAYVFGIFVALFIVGLVAKVNVLKYAGSEK